MRWLVSSSIRITKNTRKPPRRSLPNTLKLEEAVDEKQKILQETNTSLTNELSHALVYQTSNYLQGVWEVTGRQKKEIAQVVDARKLDYELLERWIKYMGRTSDKYKYKDDWQAMMKKGGTAADAKKLADRFQDDVVAAMLAKSDIDAQNKIIADKDVVGSKPKKRTDKPSNFVSNKDFNPGSDLLLKSLPDDQNNLWIEIFQREINDNIDPNDMMNGRAGQPGCAAFPWLGSGEPAGRGRQARASRPCRTIWTRRKRNLSRIIRSFTA